MKEIAKTWFTHQIISDYLYLIYEPYYYERSRCNIWLIKGNDYNLLIDTGLGVASLKDYIHDHIDNSKKIRVVAADIHFDHTGGMHEFSNSFIHETEYEALRFCDQNHILSTSEYGYISDDEFSKLPFQDFSVAQYSVKACPHIKPLKNADVINTGNRELEIIHLPGHSEGAIALYDQKEKQLFSGDVVYDGNLLDNLPGSNIEKYLDSMERLLRIEPLLVFPGHLAPFDKDKMHSIARNYINEKRLFYG